MAEIKKNQSGSRQRKSVGGDRSDRSDRLDRADRGESKKTAKWKRPEPSPQHARHMHDRLLFLLAKSVGEHVTVTTASGDSFDGLLEGACTEGDLGVSLRFASSGAKQLVFAPEDIVDVAVTLSAPLQVDQRKFRTDTDISGRRAVAERELERWTPDADTATAALTLEESSSGSWDQFAVNADRFGVPSTYDEHLYTTRINTDGPDYQAKMRRAQRLADEIEGQTGGNVHQREERGDVVDDSGMDEEDKYSGVDRTNTYVPPSQRAELPHDPAIISAGGLRKSTPSATQQPDIMSRLEQKLVDSATVPKRNRIGLPVNDQAASAAPSASKKPGFEKELASRYQKFIDLERNRMVSQKEAAKTHHDTARLNDLRKFSQDYKINTPVPEDLLPILAKDKSRDVSETTSPEAANAHLDRVASPMFDSLSSKLSSIQMSREADKSSEKSSPTPSNSDAKNGGAKPEPVAKSPSKPKFKMNFKAPEFKPFTPKDTNAQLAAEPSSPAFFAATPKSDRAPLSSQFNPFKKPKAENTPYPRAFETHPTWHTVEAAADSSVLFRPLEQLTMQRPFLHNAMSPQRGGAVMMPFYQMPQGVPPMMYQYGPQFVQQPFGPPGYRVPMPPGQPPQGYMRYQG
ncbi:PAB1-binding protein 1 [Yarrowia sp. B02]|nr:PAB1-binding protein 1 [Yarrowia sp. B02]